MKTTMKRVEKLAHEWTQKRNADEDAITAYEAGYREALADVCSMLHDQCRGCE